MILSTLWLGMRFAEAPGVARLGAFLFSGILLAQTRYESALFVLPVGAVLALVWWRQRRIEITWQSFAIERESSASSFLPLRSSESSSSALKSK